MGADGFLVPRTSVVLLPLPVGPVTQSDAVRQFHLVFELFETLRAGPQLLERDVDVLVVQNSDDDLLAEPLMQCHAQVDRTHPVMMEGRPSTSRQHAAVAIRREGRHPNSGQPEHQRLARAVGVQHGDSRTVQAPGGIAERHRPGHRSDR